MWLVFERGAFFGGNWLGACWTIGGGVFLGVRRVCFGRDCWGRFWLVSLVIGWWRGACFGLGRAGSSCGVGVIGWCVANCWASGGAERFVLCERPVGVLCVVGVRLAGREVSGVWRGCVFWWRAGA